MDVAIATEAHDLFPATAPPADVEPGSIEFLEHQVSQMSKYERHLMELAPSVLSAEEVAYSGRPREC
jgi:hypothetical protein